jgi:heme-degrading monooxygenase HmoA
MTAAYAYLWEYLVPAETAPEFERVYGPEGDWATLFRRHPGYRRTELLRDLDRGRYVTIDHWESREACEAFREAFAAEFQALDERCERLTSEETLVGEFLVLSPLGRGF